MTRQPDGGRRQERSGRRSDRGSIAPVARANRSIGLIGLGAMGTPVATRLLLAGNSVVGFDVEADRLVTFERAGGTRAASVAEVVRTASMMITLLPSSSALAEVCDAVARAAEARDAPSEPDLVDLSTLGVQTKLAARDVLSGAGVDMLDGALSGTATQVAGGDLVVYVSGESSVVDRCEPTLRELGRRVHRLGDFGQATRTKLVANHLVAIHVAAAAEALLLARRSGLDLDATLEALIDGAGTSRMLEVRGPAMATGAFEPASMRLELFLKDLDLIDSLGRDAGSPMSLFSTAAGLYRGASASSRGRLDTASVFAWLEEVAQR